MAKKSNEKGHGLTEGPNVDWSGCNVQKLYDALAKVIGEREGVKIEYKVRKKSDLTPEELEKLERKRSGNDPSNN